MPKISGCTKVGKYEHTDIEKLMVTDSWDQFFNYDVCGLIDYVTSTYDYAMIGKKNTAIAGFSMGRQLLSVMR